MPDASAAPGSTGTIRARLWIARVAAPLPRDADGWLDQAERDRLHLMRDPAERRRRTVAWTLRRWALTRAHPAIGEGEWRFVAGPHGKPELAPPFDRLGLWHNLSHAEGFAAVLIAPVPCGVDVESPPAGLEAATVVFGPSERADIAAHPQPAERFLQLWVAKEAILKLLGIGVLAAPETLELALAPDGRSAVPRSRAWNGAALPPDTGARLWPLPDRHWLAAASSGPSDDLAPEPAPWSAD